MSDTVQTTYQRAAYAAVGAPFRIAHRKSDEARTLISAEVQVVVAEEKGADHHSAAKLLGDWRAAERDTVAAKTAASISALALKTARAAEEAAVETEAAANAAQEVAERAKAAASRAKDAATHAAEFARLLSESAQADKVEANHAVNEAADAETVARDRYHDAADEGFPKD